MRQNGKRGQICPNEEVPKMATIFKFKCIISCKFILRKFQRKEYIPCTKKILKTTREGQIQDQSQTIGLDFVTFFRRLWFISEFLWNRHETPPRKLAKQQYILFYDKTVVIEEEWFSDRDLTDGANFPQALIKRAKYRFNKK